LSNDRCLLTSLCPLALKTANESLGRSLSGGLLPDEAKLDDYLDGRGLKLLDHSMLKCAHTEQ
jgi:hypothetical protein